MSDGEKLWFALQEEGYVEYGKEIPVSFVHDILGIVMPEVGTRKDFDRLMLRELTAIDYVKRILVDAGMWLTRAGDRYRIPLPSENSHYAANMIASAGRKLKRASRLVRNTHDPDGGPPDQSASRIMMLEESIRAARRNRDILR